MSGFSASWLRLREPADAAARAGHLVTAVAAAAGEGPKRVVDLGAGTGANLRYLAPRLGGRQHWTLLDADDGLLTLAAARTAAAAADGATVGASSADSRSFVFRGPGFACDATCVRVDLAALTASDGVLPLAPAGLVTASALLDLVSAEWLGALATHCARERAAVLFALTYDGRIELSPADPFDDAIRSLVNHHQRTDKGFGPALGPAAVDTALAELGARGYRLDSARSDWRLGAAHAALQRELLGGWAEAARELAPERVQDIDAWLTRRLERVAAGRSEIVVGHVDVAGTPGDRPVRARG